MSGTIQWLRRPLWLVHCVGSIGVCLSLTTVAEGQSGCYWRRVRPGGPAPAARTDHAMVFVDQLSCESVILFGGLGASLLPPGREPRADTWRWNGTAWEDATSPLISPPRRYGHAMAYDNDRHVIVLFGGTGDGGELGDTWEYDCALSTWREVFPVGLPALPSARSEHGMTYDPARQRVVMFGGSGEQPYLNDTWEYYIHPLFGTVWQLRDDLPPLRPPARAGHAMTFDAGIPPPPLMRVAVLFGGRGVGGTLGDTWTYDGATWTQCAGGGLPGARDEHAMTYDSRRGVSVLFSGSGSTLFAADTFQLDLAGGSCSWGPIPQPPFDSAPPTSRMGHALAYDRIHAEAVLFGGEDDRGLLGDTWVLACLPMISIQPQSRTVQPGADATFVVTLTAIAHESPTFQWRRNGTAVQDDGRISGASASMLTIHHCRPEDNGAYDVIVTGRHGTTRSDPAMLLIRLLAGDMDGSGIIDGDDIQPFLSALINP